MCFPDVCHGFGVAEDLQRLFKGGKIVISDQHGGWSAVACNNDALVFTLGSVDEVRQVIAHGTQRLYGHGHNCVTRCYTEVRSWQRAPRHHSSPLYEHMDAVAHWRVDHSPRLAAGGSALVLDAGILTADDDFLDRGCPTWTAETLRDNRAIVTRDREQDR
jgi:hypothetical protein